jgi:hypothetical protein
VKLRALHQPRKVGPPAQKMMRIRIVPVGTFLLIAVGVIVPNVAERADAQASNVVELTQVDLFRLTGWPQKAVAVYGFTIGMARQQAFEIAKANGLKLGSQGPFATPQEETNSSCHEGWCEVHKIGGNWIGLNLFFQADHLTKIKVSVPADADPDVKKSNVAHSFKGLTHQFFNSYSDALREKLLGRVEGKQTHDLIRGQPDPSFTHIEYDYPHSGLIIHATVSERDPRPFDLEVDFVTRQ